MCIIQLRILVMHLFCCVVGIVTNTIGILLRKMHIFGRLKCN